MNDQGDITITHKSVPGAFLTVEECEALYELIDSETGGNAENVFGDEPDPDDVTSVACAKVFAAAGREVPDGLLPEGIVFRDGSP